MARWANPLDVSSRSIWASPGARFLGLLLLATCVGGLVEVRLRSADAVGRSADVERGDPGSVAPPSPQSVVSAPPWRLGGDGWVIRVDGAEVELPAFLDQVRSQERSEVGMTISPYDHIIVSQAKAAGFDWRLIAAVIFEESGFRPDAESDRGAYGLMQVRAIAARDVGEEEFHSPEDNVRTGVRYLRQLDEMFRDVSPAERLPFVLAAYNMGPAHVRDAQEVARRLGYDPGRWESGVALVAPLLEQPAIYVDLPAGFALGSQTVAYVRRVTDRFEQYVREIPSGDEVLAGAFR